MENVKDWVADEFSVVKGGVDVDFYEFHRFDNIFFYKTRSITPDPLPQPYKKPEQTKRQTTNNKQYKKLQT